MQGIVRMIRYVKKFVSQNYAAIRFTLPMVEGWPVGMRQRLLKSQPQLGFMKVSDVSEKQHRTIYWSRYA